MLIFYLQPEINFKFKSKANMKALILIDHSISHGNNQLTVLHEILGNVLTLFLYGSRKTNILKWINAYFGFSQTVFSIKKEKK